MDKFQRYARYKAANEDYENVFLPETFKKRNTTLQNYLC